MAFPKGFRLKAGYYYRLGDRSGPYVIDAAGQARLVGGNGSVVVAPMVLASAPNPAGNVGQAYRFQPITVSGTSPIVFAIASGSLPAGLSLNTSTGLISGVPTTAGTSTFTLRATDANNQIDNLGPFQIRVGATGSALALYGDPILTGTVGVSFSFQLGASGGVQPYTFAVASGTLPSGISLNASTGLVSGTPTAAATSSNIVLGVTDAAGETVSLAPFSVTIAVAPATLTISGTPSPTATVGTPYSFTPTASGGVTPRSFALVAGTLPAGLSFNTATGAITGTPTAAGSATGLSIRVTDNVGATATLASFGITVSAGSAGLSISGTPGTAATVGTQYSFTPTAAGGTTPYTFSINAGTLPAGLSINSSTGAITGTPTTAGTSAGIVVRVTDNAGATANLAAFTLTVAAAASGLRASAPYDVQLSGVQNNATNTGRINCGNVNIGTAGGTDWSLFIQTDWRDTNVNKGGGLISVGNQADNLQTAAGNLALWVNGSGTSTGNPWSTDNAYAGTMMLTAQDDANNNATSRKVVSTMLPGTLSPWPLVGKASVVQQPGSFSHGVLVKCEAGVVSLWDVDPINGPVLLDKGPGLTSARSDGTKGTWTSILNKPLFLGFLNLVTQSPRTYWGGPIGQVVLWNGGAMTEAQAILLAQGVDARDVLPFDAARGDRYWPGNQLAGDATKMEELIAGQHGTIEGVGASFISTARVQTADAGATLAWEDGTIWSADKAPATTSTVRAWGTRRNTEEVQVRLVSTTAANPAAAGDVLVPWTTMGNITEGFRGDLPGVPHAAGVKFKAQIRWKLANGDWSPERYAHGTFGCGVGAIAAGQSIVSKMMQASGPSRAIAAGSVGKLSSWDMFHPIGTLNRMPTTNTSLWQDSNASSFTLKWGQRVIQDLLVQMTGQRAFLMDMSIEGIKIERYAEGSGSWERFKRAIQMSRPRYIIWNQGHGDLEMNQAARWAAMTDLLTRIKAAVASAPGGAFTFTFLVIPVGSDWIDQLNSMRNYDQTWALAQAAAGEPVKLFTSINDQPNDGDMIHPAVTSADMGCMCERIATGLAYEQGYSTHDANGGFLGAGTWSWAGGVVTVDIPITGGSGTYVTRGGGAPSGLRLQLSGGASALPDTTQLMTGPDRVRCTVASASAPSSVSYTYMSGYPGTVGNGTKPTLAQSGIENCLFDTRSTPMVSGLPGMPIMGQPAAVTVAPA